MYRTYVPANKFAKVRLEGTMAQELSTAYAVKKLYDAGYLLEVETAMGKPPVPCIHHIKRDGIQDGDGDSMLMMPVPGKRYPLNNICAQ